VAHTWVDMCTFKILKKKLKKIKKVNVKNKKIQKNHEMTRGSHCSWPLMI